MSHHLHQLASLWSMSATLRYERKFKVSLLEWRAIGMLGGFAPLSLKELARRAGLDKSYASRTISGLIERGWVISERDNNDGRGVMLRLSKSGDELYRRILPDAVSRNERMLSTLTREQRAQLSELLALLNVSARKLLEEERRAAAGEAVDGDDVPAAPRNERNGPAGSAGMDLEEMRCLVTRLGELVGMTQR
jgi:DNA-binding MarR family transcriptional regulator